MRRVECAGSGCTELCVRSWMCRVGCAEWACGESRVSRVGCFSAKPIGVPKLLNKVHNVTHEKQVINKR